VTITDWEVSGRGSDRKAGCEKRAVHTQDILRIDFPRAVGEKRPPKQTRGASGPSGVDFAAAETKIGKAKEVGGQLRRQDCFLMSLLRNHAEEESAPGFGGLYIEERKARAQLWRRGPAVVRDGEQRF